MGETHDAPWRAALQRVREMVAGPGTGGERGADGRGGDAGAGVDGRGADVGANGRWRRFVPTRVELLLGIGLSLYFAWVDCMFYGARLVDIGRTPYPSLDANTAVYYVSILVLCAVLIAIAVRHRQAARPLFHPRAFVLGPVGMCISTLCLFLAAADGVVRVAGIVLAGVASGVFSAVCLMQWGEVSSALSQREIVVSGALGYASSSFVSAAFQGVASVTAVSSVAVGVALVLLVAVMPLVSGGILGYFVRSESVSLEAREPVDPTPNSVEEARRSRGIVHRISAALVVIGFIPNTCRDLNFAMAGTDGYVGGSPQVYLQMALVVVVVSILIVGAFLSKDPLRSVPVCYRVIVFLALVSVCLMPMAIIVSSATIGLTSLLVLGALNSLHLMMWIATVGICRRYRERTVEYFAVMRLFWAVGPLLGSLFVRVAGRAGVGLPLLYVDMAICVLALFLTYSTVLPEHVLTEALAIVPKKYRKPFKERCRMAAEIYGLTDRQLEIMMLFAKGRDSAYIQKELCLSKSTVSTHRQHIYAKLGVHSQQELLNRLYELEPPA